MIRLLWSIGTAILLALFVLFALYLLPIFIPLFFAGIALLVLFLLGLLLLKWAMYLLLPLFVLGIVLFLLSWVLF